MALRLGFGMATEWSVTARRAGQEFRRAPSRGPMVPGLRYRRRANAATVLLTRMAHPGIAPVRPDEADSQLAFASPPWPDLPRHRRDRLSHPHPPDPAPTTRTVPDPAPVRAGEQYGSEGYQTDWGSNPHLRRYLRRQVSISHWFLMCSGKGSEMGPCLRRGLRREERSLSHKHRFPGACRGLLLMIDIIR